MLLKNLIKDIPIKNKKINVKGLAINSKKIKALLINTRNANAFTGKNGFQSLKEIAEDLSNHLTQKKKDDDEEFEKIKPTDILFGCTGTIGEIFP